MKLKEELKNIDINANVTTEDMRKIIYLVFCVSVMLSPIIPEKVGFGLVTLKNTLFNILAILSGVCLIAIDIKEKKIIKLNKFDIILIIYLAIVILSAIFSKYGFVKGILGTNGRGEGVMTILSYIITFMIAERAFKKDKNMFKVLMIGMIVASIYGIVQANVPNDIKLFFGAATTNGTAKSTFGNQNFFSSYLCLVLPVSCYYFINNNGKKYLIYLLSCGLGFAGLVFSRTLGGYLTFSGMFLVVSIFSFIYSKNRKIVLWKIIILGVIFALTFAGISYKKDDTYIQEIKETTKEVEKLANNDKSFGTGRMEIWQKTLMVINKYKVLGVGPDSLGKELRDKSYVTNGENDILNKYIIDKAHSEPLNIAATTGIISLVVYIIFIATLGTRLLIITINKNNQYLGNNEDTSQEQQRKYITMILISIMGYFIQSLINISVVEVAPMYWFVLGLGSGTIFSYNKIKTF